MIAKAILLALLIGIAASIAAIRSGYLEIPARYNPWAPLVLDEAPHFLTGVKLARLSKDRQLCQDVLASSGFAYEVLPDRITGYACGFHNAVRIERTSTQVGEPFSLSCRAAVSLALWERHVLQPQALALFGQRERASSITAAMRAGTCMDDLERRAVGTQLQRHSTLPASFWKTTRTSVCSRTGQRKVPKLRSCTRCATVRASSSMAC